MIKTPLECLSKNKFDERTPDYCILFNQNNIEPFLLYNNVHRENIIIEGVPFFDKFYLPSLNEDDFLFVIEHPYLEEGILDWTDSFHEKFARALEEFSIKKGVHIYIKLHPRSNIDNWKRYNLNNKFITILQNEDPKELLLAAKLILGYSSTLLNAMIQVKKNVVLLGWHPNPQIFGDDFSKWGLCHLSSSINDLYEKYDNWISNNLCLLNARKYEDFLKEYNYPFDGNASKRVIETLRTL